MADKMLMAMVGGTFNDEPAGLMMGGYCIPLAASGRFTELLEAEGDGDEAAEWLSELEVKPPRAGGLWVIEGELEDATDETRFNLAISKPRWRTASKAEIEALVARQKVRATRDDEFTVPSGEGRWVFLGARV
jgi:hypothetical protein